MGAQRGKSAGAGFGLATVRMEGAAGGYKYRTYRIRGAMRSPQIEAALKRSMRRTP